MLVPVPAGLIGAQRDRGSSVVFTSIAEPTLAVVPTSSFCHSGLSESDVSTDFCGSEPPHCAESDSSDAPPACMGSARASTDGLIVGEETTMPYAIGVA